MLQFTSKHECRHYNENEHKGALNSLSSVCNGNYTSVDMHAVLSPFSSPVWTWQKGIFKSTKGELVSTLSHKTAKVSESPNSKELTWKLLTKSVASSSSPVGCQEEGLKSVSARLCCSHWTGRRRKPHAQPGFESENESSLKLVTLGGLFWCNITKTTRCTEKKKHLNLKPARLVERRNQRIKKVALENQFFIVRHVSKAFIRVKRLHIAGTKEKRKYKRSKFKLATNQWGNQICQMICKGGII